MKDTGTLDMKHPKTRGNLVLLFSFLCEFPRRQIRDSFLVQVFSLVMALTSIPVPIVWGPFASDSICVFD